jgi:hypothetical protein
VSTPDAFRLVRDLRIMQESEDERNGDAAPQTARHAAEMIESLSVRLYWAERNLASALDALKWPQGEDRSSEPPIHSVVISVCGERAGKSLRIDYAFSPETIESSKFDVFRFAYDHLCRKLAKEIARPEEAQP